MLGRIISYFYSYASNRSPTSSDFSRFPPTPRRFRPTEPLRVFIGLFTVYSKLSTVNYYMVIINKVVEVFINKNKLYENCNN